MIRALVVTLTALIALTACGADNSLGGSAGELFPLEHSRVAVLRNAEALQVSYYANRGADVDLVVRVSVALDGVTLKEGEKLELAGEYAPGHLRTTVVHLAGGEPARWFPAVKTGDLVLTRGGDAEEETAGNFSMSFEQNGAWGSGRTLYGSFRALAQDAGFGDPAPDAGL